MQRQRIMQRAADVVGFEMLFQLVALRMADDVKMIRAFGVGRFERQLQRRVVQQFMIAMRDAAAFVRPLGPDASISRPAPRLECLPCDN